ncbi:class I SAM-dependent methyltransferase [Halobacillus sp. Marseille-P3879]|uniref:class I SAM-dependent methyltransferase n=1 Tax=Halobacillus sp. Marseille-P3879 TaxID=2045014 RepID=UPI000C7C5452|nr:class I SAM-dependent methyltransferase [Halobacillus sp. Marseille-P3879]
MKKCSKSDPRHQLTKKVEYLDSRKRRDQFSPESLFELLPIHKNDTILDIGAGTGFLTIPAAKATNGIVYALDIDPNILQIAESKAEQEELKNIRFLQGELRDASLSNYSLDIVLASLVLHEIQPLPETLQRINQVLKVNGYLACVELEEEETPDKNHPRISSAKMEQELNKAGFKVSKKVYPAASIYVLIAQKQQ